MIEMQEGPGGPPYWRGETTVTRHVTSFCPRRDGGERGGRKREEKEGIERGERKRRRKRGRRRGREGRERRAEREGQRERGRKRGGRKRGETRGATGIVPQEEARISPAGWRCWWH